jgi:hypothetical protein
LQVVTMTEKDLIDVPPDAQTRCRYARDWQSL